MTPKTKEEVIKGLRDLVERLEELDKLPISGERFNIVDYCYSKTEIQEKARIIGGKWKKEIIGPDKEYSQIHLIHQTIPITLTISRDLVCKKILTYECEPMFSPEEESELELVNG